MHNGTHRDFNFILFDSRRIFDKGVNGVRLVGTLPASSDRFTNIGLVSVKSWVLYIIYMHFYVTLMTLIKSINFGQEDVVEKSIQDLSRCFQL